MAETVARDLGRRLFAACDKDDIKTAVHLLEYKKSGSFMNEKYDDDETPLFRAAKNGHLEIVRVLLQHKADVDSVNGNEGSTPLVVAAEQGNKEIVKLLVKHNANINFQKLSGSDRGWSALMCAVRKSRKTEILEKRYVKRARGMSSVRMIQSSEHMEIAKPFLFSESVESNVSLITMSHVQMNEHTKIAILLLEHGAMVDLMGDVDCASVLWCIDESFLKHGELKGTALMIACNEGQSVEIVRLLIEHGAYVNKQNDAGITPLMFAVLDKNDFESIHLVYSLLRYGACVGLRTINSGLSALMIASKVGNIKSVKLLLEHGAYVNGQSSNGESALMFANENGHEKISKVLKDHGGKIYSQPDKQTKKWLDLVFACENGCTGEVIQLLNQGVDVNMINIDDGWSLLMIVSGNGYTELAKLLLERGADVNLRNAKGLSALAYATRNGRTETIKVLCKYGADVSELYTCHGDETIANSAVQMGNTETVNKDLLDKIASLSIDVQDSEELSALMTTVKYGQIETSKSLLEPDVHRKPVLFLAVENNHTETTELLLKQGANSNIKDNKGNSALFVAVKYGDTYAKIAKLLLDYGADINTQDSELWSPLMWASHEGHIEVAKLLMEYDAQVNLQGKNGWSALMLAIQSDNVEIAQKLLENGADSNIWNNDGLSALMLAIQNDDVEMVQKLLENGADSNIRNTDGLSALMFAIQNDNVEMVRKLLENGADSNIRNNDGLSVLMLAIQNGNVEMVQKLLKTGADSNIQNNDGLSALLIATQQSEKVTTKEEMTSNLKTVELLLNHGANVNIQNNEGMTALMSAAKKSTPLMKLLLKYGAHTELRTISDGLSALLIASKNGNTGGVELLLEHGANVNARSSNGWSALMLTNEKEITEILQKYGGRTYTVSQPDDEAKKMLELIIACENGRTSKIEYLLKQGVNVNNIIIYELSALMIVSRNGYTEPTKLLLEHGANVDLKNRKGWSALMFASQSGKIKTAKLLLDYGANVNMQSNDGTSALMVSCLPELSELLLDFGADINLKNNNGASAIIVAAQKGITKVAKFLLEHGADVNAQDNEETSALMVAVKNENDETARLLLEYGADVNKQNRNMWSALMFACQRGHATMTKLLLEYGANVNFQKKNGWTALMLMLAGANANFETASLLLKYGADINIQGSDGWSALTLARNQYPKLATHVEEYKAVLVPNLIAETTVEVTNSEQHFSWQEYGLHLYIPENSLSEDVQQCTIHIEASVAGDYQLPQDTHLVSAVYSFNCVPKCQSSKPIILEMQHCAKDENTHKLCFIRSKSRADSSFQILESDDCTQFESFFPKHTTYGFIELNKFCQVAVGQRESDERDYCARVYRQRHEEDPKFHRIHFAILWDTNTHNKLAHEQYQSNRNMIMEHRQKIEFEGPKITLDIPFPGGVASGIWKITAIGPPVILKRDVDNVKKGKLIPSCQLLAKREKDEPIDLEHLIQLKGAKEPYNAFTICIPGKVHRGYLWRQHLEYPNATEITVSVLLNELSTRVSSIWEDIGIRLGLNPDTLDIISRDHPSDSKSCFKEMIKLWIRRVDPPPSWTAIIKAVDILGYQQLAEDLRDKFLKND